jgi:hypothetical protein
VAARHLGPIDVERIFLYEENPRHEPMQSEPEVIEHLCKDEHVFNLARNIAAAGLNPLELSGVIELSSSGGKKNYQVWEGNRRICAIKLLNDPDLAPAHLRRDFARLAAESGQLPIKKITAVVFDDHDDLKYWMGIIHGGEQTGVGRKTWNATQKERHFEGGRNQVALAVLDTAESLGLINKEEREGKLTTAQRFLNSELVREAIGIDTSNKEDITYNRPTADFTKQLGRFIADLKRGIKITSRHRKEQIDQYGRQLARSSDISGDRIQPMSLAAAVAPAAKKKKRAKLAPKKHRKKQHIDYDATLAQAIADISSDKLESLYHSICNVQLEPHTPLLTIGVWAFVESLCARAGKSEGTAFTAFLSNQKLSDLGASGSARRPIRDALDRIEGHGNATKHDRTAGSFDGKQLANDFATITPVMVKLLESLAPKK